MAIIKNFNKTTIYRVDNGGFVPSLNNSGSKLFASLSKDVAEGFLFTKNTPHLLSWEMPNMKLIELNEATMKEYVGLYNHQYHENIQSIFKWQHTDNFIKLVRDKVIAGNSDVKGWYCPNQQNEVLLWQSDIKFPSCKAEKLSANTAVSITSINYYMTLYTNVQDPKNFADFTKVVEQQVRHHLPTTNHEVYVVALVKSENYKVACASSFTGNAMKFHELTAQDVEDYIKAEERAFPGSSINDTKKYWHS